jgi:outer membrane protein
MRTTDYIEEPQKNIGGNKRMRSLLVIFTAFLLAGIIGLSQVSAAEKDDQMQIATVNIQDVLLGSEAGKEVKKVLEEKVLEFQGKFQQGQEEIEALRAEIEKKSSVWSQEVREEKERDYQKKVREMQLKSEDAQFEVQQLEKQVMGPILKDLQQVIADMGAKYGYAMIMDSRAGLLYVDKTLDISDLVRKELDAKLTSAKAAK